MDGLRFYLDDMEGNPVTTTSDDIGRVGNTSDERLDYATQKPEALLEHMINASSKAGDLVVDFFCVRKGTRILTSYPLSKYGEGESHSPSPG